MYDVVIIGAGISGLVCGCYLAKTGAKVLIVDKNERPGGYCSSFEKDGFVFDTAAHYFGGCESEGILGRIFNELDVNMQFSRFDPTDRFLFSDQLLEVPMQFSEYIRLLRDMFPKEKENISSFSKICLDCYQNNYDANIIAKYARITYQRLLDTFFADDRLKTILGAQTGYLGLPPDRISAIAAILMSMSYLKDGAFYPVGGSQAVPNSIAKRFKDYGGALLLSNKVRKIIIKDKTVGGVLLENGREIKADVVVSNVDATQAFFDLIDASILDTDFKSNLKSYSLSISFFKMYLVVEETTARIKSICGWHFPSYDLNRDFDKFLYVDSPTMLESDDSKKRRHVVDILRVFPYKFDEVDDWDLCKGCLEEETLIRIDRLLNGIKDAVVLKESATPKTFEKYTLNKYGAAFGWALSPEQSFFKRLNNLSPIKRLYLVGHWTMQGAGIASVATSGIKTGKLIKKRQFTKGKIYA